MHPEFFRTVAVFAHHGTASRVTHLGPVHKWLAHQFGLTPNQGTLVLFFALIAVVGLVVMARRRSSQTNR